MVWKFELAFTVCQPETYTSPDQLGVILIEAAAQACFRDVDTISTDDS